MDDMVAFITGGGSGIGEAAAKLLARRGARVALAGRTPDQLAKVAEAIGGAGGTAITVTCDVSDEDSVRSAIATTVETWGRLDVVVANAGVNGTWAGIEELAVEEFRSTLDINLVGTFTTIKYAVPHLRRRGGSVIVTSSVNGTRIAPFRRLCGCPQAWCSSGETFLSGPGRTITSIGSVRPRIATVRRSS
jgi:NAD(P)-dependent dehydrogenase (short-subunit alcohol dehydrogenase family)